MKTALALALAAIVAAAASPALACGGGHHAKAYRSVETARKPTAAPQEAPAAALPTTEGLQTTAAVSGLSTSTEL